MRGADYALRQNPLADGGEVVEPVSKMSNTSFPIQVAARLTGLTAHVIRIWEQRYAAVTPHRTASNRRLYSPREIDRLILLRDATQAGFKIHEVAAWSMAQLRQALNRAKTQETTRSSSPMATSLDECRAAIKAFDSHAFLKVLQRVEISVGALALLQKLLGPLAQSLGEWWRAGDITSAHEHFATVEIRGYLTQAARPYGDLAHAPVLLVTTPAGQIHELGALLAAAMAAHCGWRVIYLGASLPAAEIAGAARSCGADAIALSLVFPGDDRGLPGELLLLRKLLPITTPILIGGRASELYQKSLKTIGAITVSTLPQLGKTLDRLREETPPQRSRQVRAKHA
jgi:DNA-binding transcriptional MerR regulator/methylmalonyl-CoA mutase cobalamin-binding subunit